MDDLDKKILDFIKKSGWRIKLNFLITKILMGLKASLILSLIILIAALFTPFKYCYELSGLTIVISLIVSITFGFLKAPKKNEVALIADSKGLGERIITAVELLGDEREIARVQKEDTVRKIETFNLKRNLPIFIHRKDIYKIIILVVVCFIVILIPTEAKKEAMDLRNFDILKNEVAKKIDKEEKKLEKNNELTIEEREKLKKILEQGKKELKEVNKEEDANKLMDRMEKKFDELKSDTNSENEKQFLDDLKKNIMGEEKKEAAKEALKDLNRVNNGLNKSKLGKELIETLKGGDREALENKLKELKNSLKNSSDKEKNELSNALKDAAANLSDKNLKQLLEEASDNVLDGEIDSSELADALASLNASSNSQKGENSSGTGQGVGSGDSNSNGDGSGSGSGSGSGNGNGSGNGGGWNTGSKDGQENNSKASSGEKVFIPGRKIGNDDNLKGNKSDSGAAQSIETEKGINFNGEKKDYNSVVGDYSKEEIDSMNNSSLPENLQGVVKNYFNNIK